MAGFTFCDAWGARITLEHCFFDLGKREVSGVCVAHVLGGGMGEGEGVGRRCRIAPVSTHEWLAGESRQRRAGRVPLDAPAAKFEGAPNAPVCSGGYPRPLVALVRSLRANLSA
jgi:hypothetical protein